MNSGKTAQSVSHGVDALIGQLKDEGVAAGRKEAAAIVEAARDEAARIVAEAKTDAERRRAEADEEARRLERTARDALAAATRDAVLHLRSQLLERFSADVRRLVSEAMLDPDLVRRMIVEVASGARDAAGVKPDEPISAVLPRTVEDAFDLRHDLETLRKAPLTQLVLARTGAILAEGVTLGEAGEDGSGLLLRLRDGDLEIDLSDEAVASVLLAYLEPRFRALFDGIIR